MSPPPEPARGISVIRTITLMIVSFAIMFVLGSSYSIAKSAAEESYRNNILMATREVGMALFYYSKDHDGKYPEGKSSTEIFQQLIDQKYVTDPALFYFPMKGKSKPVGSKLKPENVCWDVTADVQPDDPDYLPIVFLTGYKVQYGTDQTSVVGIAYGPGTFMPFYTRGNASEYARVDQDGTARVLASTNSPTRVYHQLTPDGPLP